MSTEKPVAHGGKRKGAGRKRGEPKRAITVRVDEYTHSRFTLYCHLAKRSQAKAFALLLANASPP